MAGDEETKKTSLELPVSLWKSAKKRAVDDEVDLRTVMIRALEMYLKADTPKAKGGRDAR
jgi:hypothetical protein